MSESPNKDELYGKFQQTADWQDNLHKRAAHKALDIGEDPMIIANNQKSGISGGWLAAIVAGIIVAMLGAGGLGFGLSMLTQPTQPARAVAPIESQEYTVEFFAEDGTKINVEAGNER